MYICDIENEINHYWSGVFGADSMHFPLHVYERSLFSCIHWLMTWVVIWDSNRFTLCFSDNMVFMGYQLPEGRKPGYDIMTIMGNSTASPSLVNEWD